MIFFWFLFDKKNTKFKNLALINAFFHRLCSQRVHETHGLQKILSETREKKLISNELG